MHISVSGGIISSIQCLIEQKCGKTSLAISLGLCPSKWKNNIWSKCSEDGHSLFCIEIFVNTKTFFDQFNIINTSELFQVNATFKIDNAKILIFSYEIKIQNGIYSFFKIRYHLLCTLKIHVLNVGECLVFSEAKDCYS